MLSYTIGNDRLSVKHDGFPEHDEWLGFVISKTSTEVLVLVVEAVDDCDCEEVMQLWDGAVLNY